MKKTALVAGLLLLLLVPAAFWWLCLRPIPAMTGREPISGLDQEVVVEFDAHAVPYIQARSEEDAYIAQGFVTARERVFQMDMLRRSAIGQMSEVFGAVALPTDRLVRTLGIPKLASQEYAQLSPQAKSALQAYTRGVNAYLSQNGGKLGIEFTILGYTPQPWRPEDSIAILKHLGYRSDESWRLDDFRQRVANRIGEKRAAALFHDDIAHFGLPASSPTPASSGSKKPGTPPTALPRSTADEPSARFLLNELAALGDAVSKDEQQKTSWGSTSVAIPNARTRTGGAMLACDKHGPLTAPNEYFSCSLNAPNLHVAGATIPGVPGIWCGRNEDIAWGSSNLKADVQDIYLEQFNSPFDPSYRVGQKWLEANVRTELIPVRLGKDVEHKIVTTRHGPVLLRNGDMAISLSWTGNAVTKPTFDAIYSVNHAHSWNEFTTALQKYVDPPQLFVFADRLGNVGMQAAGVIPKRTNPIQGTMLMLGTEPGNKWDSYVPFDKLPTSYTAARSGLEPLIAANQLPNKTASLLGHQWNAPYRANRLLATITQAKQPIAVGDLNALQGDEFTPVAPVLAKALQQSALATNYIDQNGLQAIVRLIKWDGQLTAGSVDASIYQNFLETLARRLIEPSVGREMATEYLQRWPMWKPLAESVIRDRPAGLMPPEERTYDEFFLDTLTQTLKTLAIVFDESDQKKWAWGKIHQAGFRHVSPNATPLFRGFALGPVPVGGDADTLNSCDVQQDPRGLHYNSQSGPTQRMIVDMADRDKFYQALSTGQSGHRFSPYRADQMNAWQRVDLAPIAFSSDQLMRQAKHRLVLENKYGN